MMAPMMVPTTIPAAIKSKEMISRSTRVATTAISMPMDAIAFPDLAVFGEPSRLRPRMKNISAPM